MKKMLRLLSFFLMAAVLFTACSDDDPNIAPELAVNEGVVVENGKSVIITDEMLKVSDVDTNSEALIYQITKATENGTLVHVNDETVAVTSFSQKDIEDQLIKYIHDGSKTLTDFFEFAVSDGETTLIMSFNISIGEKQIAYIYVLNEGNDNGSVSYINTNNVVVNNYFSSVNGLPLGKFPQSMAVNDKHAFIVVTTTTGAGYIEVVDKSTFKHVKTIFGFSYPREIVLLDGKAYVSNGTGADGNYMKQNSEIYPINLSTYEVGNKIGVGAGPEKMVVSNGKLYVANSGGWSNDDNTVTIVDVTTDQIIDTKTVKSCPKDMEVDANGDVWVYCGGKPDFSNWPNVAFADAGISKISATDGSVTSWDFPKTTGGTKNIAISKDKETIYYMSDAVYSMDITAAALPTEKLIDQVYYGIDVHPVTGELWLCKEVDATTAGTVYVYSVDGVKQNEFVVGSMPNSTVFAY